jgi:hypothetical protein
MYRVLGIVLLLRIKAYIAHSGRLNTTNVAYDVLVIIFGIWLGTLQYLVYVWDWYIPGTITSTFGIRGINSDK